MRLFLDGHEVRSEAGGALASVAAALAAGVAAAESQGRIVIEALADGSPMGDEMLTSPPQTEAGVREIRLLSARPAELVRVTLLDAADAVEKVGVVQSQAARLIREGEASACLAPLGEALGVWQQVRDAVERSAAILGVDLNRVTLGDSMPVSRHADELAASLIELKTGLESEDWAALSDTLAHDLNARAVGWREMLRELADVIAPKGGGGGAR
ncbi:MAG: hypothetical protein IPK69_00405 [Phycisphaerales bacterium]|nr:MAG: hypothetical protein IPK69_00405 [Phycisphaerales bacterium]